MPSGRAEIAITPGVLAASDFCNSKTAKGVGKNGQSAQGKKLVQK